jgi:hypothetical protein
MRPEPTGTPGCGIRRLQLPQQAAESAADQLEMANVVTSRAIQLAQRRTGFVRVLLYIMYIIGTQPVWGRNR